MQKIVCLHTAEVHRATFDGLLASSNHQAEVSHVVRPDWLDRARREGVTPELRSEIETFLTAAAEAVDAVLCSCSTLGPVADLVRGKHANVVRIDRPLMEKAASHDGTIVVAICLESTRSATLALLDEVVSEAGRTGHTMVVLCAEAWPFFERGDADRFASSIAAKIEQVVSGLEDVSCIVLGQASMAVAEPLLSKLGVPVYSSPQLAAAETLRIATKGAA